MSTESLELRTVSQETVTTYHAMSNSTMNDTASLLIITEGPPPLIPRFLIFVMVIFIIIVSVAIGIGIYQYTRYHRKKIWKHDFLQEEYRSRQSSANSMGGFSISGSLLSFENSNVF